MSATILGIDPGVSATGLVLISGTRSKPVIEQAKTLTTKTDDGSFDSLKRRCYLLVEQMLTFISEVDPDAIVVESFEDIAPLRGAKLRYYTPFLLGLLDANLYRQAVPFFYQSPRAKKPYAAYKDLWAKRVAGDALFPGDRLLTNDHLRDAAVHALIYLDGLT